MSRSAALSTGWAHRYGGWTVPRPGPFGAGRPPVTFGPDTPLQLSVQLALGADLTVSPSAWTWTDVTGYVRYNPGITVTTGRADESAKVDAGRASLTLDNRDGRFSRHNPTGPYYGLFTRNTPILVTINAGNFAYRAVEMFVNSWPARWDKTVTDFTTAIECSGIIRRLAQSGGKTKSALYRTIEDSDPLAWWPLEAGDERATTSSPSGIPGDTPLHADAAVNTSHIDTGTVGGGVTGPPGAGRAIDLSTGGELWGLVPRSNSTDPWRVEIGILFTEALGASVTGSIIRIAFGNATVELFAEDGTSNTTVLTFTDDATTVTENDNTILDDGNWHHIRLDCQSSGGGADTAYQLYVDGTEIMNSTASSIRFSSVTGVVVSRTGDLDAASHLVVWSGTLPSALTGYNAFTGHTGETAVERIERVCGEEGVAITIHSGVRESAALGVQSVGSVLDILREAETADNGVLYENGFGLGYQALAARYNAPVSMSLDFSNGDVAEEPESVDDDQKLRNSWSVTRVGGQTATVTDTGSVSFNGLYDESVSASLEQDSQAEQLAAWLLHIGINEEARWPTLSLNFATAAGRSLIQAWTELPYGARITLDNSPTEITSDLVDLFIEGKTERFTRLEWNSQLNTTPATPYTVGVLDDDVLGRLSPEDDDSELNADIDSTATSIAVARLDPFNPLWTTDAEDFPFDINVGGERMTVTTITGASSPQTFAVTRSVNGVVKSHTTGTAVALWTPLILTV